MDNFDWGNADELFKKLINQEIFVNNIYQKFFLVEENDIVLDFGASVGPFAYSILEKKPKHVFCYEPDFDLFKTLVKNTLHGPVTCINKAISNQNGLSDKIKILNFPHGYIYKTIPSVTFKNIIESYNLTKVDFMKTDCEGGEYDIFTEENILWIKKNVKKIVGEWHLSTPELKQNFKYFRDNILPYFSNYQVFSVDGVDIKWSLFNDDFIDYYNEITIYLDNR